MKTKLIFLENRRKQPWFIGYAMATRAADLSIQYIGYSIENVEGDFIGDDGTSNYFYIK